MAIIKCPNCGGENEVFSKKGQKCDYCGAMIQLPSSYLTSFTIFDECNETDVDEQISKAEKELQDFNRKYNVFLFFSGIFTFLFGMLLFLFKNASLHERIEKRLNNQMGFVKFLNKLQKKEGLTKRGKVSKNQLKAIDEEIFEGYDDLDFDSEDDITPKTITDINIYISKTKAMKNKLKNRMRRFWLWYIFYLILIGGIILYTS